MAESGYTFDGKAREHKDSSNVVYTNMTASCAQFAQTPTSDDLELVHATQQGDLSAFEQLVARYDGKLFRIARNVTHNREDSEDAVQEAFLKAFEYLGRL